MKKSYFRRFQKLIQLLGDTDLIEHARKGSANTFTRKRKMPLKDILTSCLAKKGLTTVMELRHYFKQKGGARMKLSKQGYLQQRKRLNPDVFTYLNDEYLRDFYHSNEPELWNGYLVVAIDGSRTEVPNSDENRKCFGESSNQHTEHGAARALVSTMYDVLNEFYLDIQIGRGDSNETVLAKKNLEHLSALEIQTPVLVLMDRGYPSLELIDILEKSGIHYLLRFSLTNYRKERLSMSSFDEVVTLKHTPQRLSKIRKKNRERYQQLKEKGKTTVRMLTTTLPCGKELNLLASLCFDCSGEQLQDLYYRRWKIETKYHTLKNKIKLESVTGKASIYVYQDFRSQILVYNMIQDVRRASDEAVKESQEGKKHPMHTNENIAIGIFKDEMIDILLEHRPGRREKRLKELQAEIEEYVLPIRDLKSTERKPNVANKYKNNQKNSF